MKAANSKFGQCCFFIEARNGVSLICFVQFAYSIVCAIALLSHDPRFLTSGYHPEAGRFQAYYCILGLVTSVLGFLGVYDAKYWWLRIFLAYLVVKLAIAAGVFVIDMATLMKCEGWANTLEGQINFTPALYAISRKGVCPVARLSYVVGFALDFGVNAYWASVIYSYINKMITNPSFGMGVLTGVDNHMTVSWYDPEMEPSNHLHQLKKPTETHGRHYGAAHPDKFKKASFGA